MGMPIMTFMPCPFCKNTVYKANLMLATGLVGGNPDMLSWDQVNQLKGSGLIYFTNHTWSHYAISNGPQDKIESEIDTACAANSRPYRANG